jgi:hypothetical protein
MSTRDVPRALVLLIAGAAILASAILHGTINVPHLREDMLEIGVRPGLLGAISLVLYFSVAAMFAFAALVLAGAVAVLNGKAPHVPSLWLIGATYLTFGLGAFVVVDPNAHFLGYALMGVLVSGGAALSRLKSG